VSSRRKSRELAVQMLFQWDLGGHRPEHVIATFLRGRKLDSDAEAFARALFEGAIREVERLDELIRQHSEHWRLERMPALDRNLVRIALYELLYFPETPPAVVINEALQISRRFSGAESVAFVNGVLDSVRRELQPNSPERHRTGS